MLIPFQLVRLRKAIEKERTRENLEALKRLVTHDIIGSINENVAAGYLNLIEGEKLRQMTLKLYCHIYDKYEEMEEEGVNAALEEALILDIDIWEQKMKKREKELAEKRCQLENAKQRLEDTERQLENANQRLESTGQRLENAKQQLGEKKRQLDEADRRLTQAEKENQAFRFMLQGKSDQEICKATGLTQKQLAALRS